MAPRKKAPAKTQTKEIATWEEEMARDAEAAARMEASAGGVEFFGTQGGILTWQGVEIENNEMGVIILDHVLENVYYEGDYDPDDPVPPLCFAFGRDDEKMQPHPNVIKVNQGQSDFCSKCPKNEWASADKGRGKACRNTRRLALCIAGQFKDGKFELFDEPSHYSTTEIGFLRLPVTSCKGFAGYVKQLASALKRPPYGVITRVKIEPDKKTQFKVVFTAIEKAPNDIIQPIRERRQGLEDLLTQPYMLEAGGEEGKPAKKKKAAPKAKRGNRKY